MTGFESVIWVTDFDSLHNKWLTLWVVWSESFRPTSHGWDISHAWMNEQQYTYEWDVSCVCACVWLDVCVRVCLFRRVCVRVSGFESSFDSPRITWQRQVTHMNGWAAVHVWMRRIMMNETHHTYDQKEWLFCQKSGSLTKNSGSFAKRDLQLEDC